MKGNISLSQVKQLLKSSIILLLVLSVFYLISLQNYLLFHGIIELAGIAVAVCIFIIVWNTRKVITNTFFLITGISFLFIGSIDLIHTLAYKGMGVFPGSGADLPTQLWIAARAFQSVTFFIAALCIGRSITKERRYDADIVIVICTLACSFLYASIFIWHNFPSCFIEGSGLTPFKITSEYIISAILVATIIVLYIKRRTFDPEVWQLLTAAQIFLIIGELAFTSYISVYGFMNLLGHLSRFISVYLFYRAIVVVSLTQPYNLLFRELKKNEEDLKENENRFRQLVESTEEGLIIHRDGIIVDFNDRICEIVGYNREEMKGKEIFSLIAPDYVMLIKDRISTQYDRSYEIMGLKKDGTQFWAEVHGRILSSPKGNLRIVTIWDTTKRHQSEERKSRISKLKDELLVSAPLEEKLRKVTDSLISVFGADIARIWFVDKGDLCTENCRFASADAGHEQCQNHDRCLHLMVSSGRFTTINGEYNRIPFSELMIGRIVSGDEEGYVTNDLAKDPKTPYHAWAVSLGLVSFGGYRLISADGKSIGVLGFFSKNPIDQEMDDILIDLSHMTSLVIQTSQVEAALRASEDQFRRIIENLPFLLSIITKEGKIRYINPQGLEFYGFESEEIAYDSSIPVFWADQDQRKKWISQIESFGMASDFEMQVKIANDKDFWFSETGILIRYNDEPCVLLTQLDITGRKEAELAIRESEKQFRSLFDNMLEGLAYCRMYYGDDGEPSDWMYLDVNDAFEENTGLSDVKGRLASEVFPGIRQESPELFEMYNRVVKTGVPVTFETYFTHLKIWLHISVYKPRDEHFVAMFENISGRKQAEEQLQKVIREHQTILENVPAMISFKDIDNRYVKVNPAVAQIIGRPIKEIEGRTLSELFPVVIDKLSDTDREVIQSKKPKYGILEELTSPQGELLWVLTDIVPLIDEHEEVIGVLVVSTDITENKLAKDAISHANHKLNLLSGITRHDIGNELQVIYGYIGLVEGKEMEPSIRESIEKVMVSAQHIERQIAFTRDYQDIGVHSPVWQDVGMVISQVVQNLNSSPILIHSEISGIEIYADPLIGKVFFNLIDNAKRYGETITEIRFSGIEREEGYTIICEDDGVGIPEEFKGKIFNREYYKHTGFGLNLSREILDITGITIREAGIPGEGARFEILVPKGKWRIVE